VIIRIECASGDVSWAFHGMPLRAILPGKVINGTASSLCGTDFLDQVKRK
jgi:hypothetical protein